MTELFGPGWGNYAIQGIVEVTEPAAVSLRPTTPGWWLLLAALALLALRHAWRLIQRWRRDRYRRDALAELQSVRARVSGGESAALAELAPLLRAIALQLLPRSLVASASGEHWRDALAQLAPQLPPLPLEQIHRFAYASTNVGAKDASDVLDQLERWIAAHRHPDD